MQQFRLYRSLILLLALACSPTIRHAQAQTETTPANSKMTVPSSMVLAMEGRGGKVALGDSLKQAQKAFPPPKGAEVGAARSYAILGREGWSWGTEKPAEAFEVSLQHGKVVGISRAIEMPRVESRKKLLEQTIAKAGAPTDHAEGKSMAIYAWDEKPNARLLIELKNGFLDGVPMMLSLVGSQDDLKTFGYQVDHLNDYIKRQEDLAEAVKKAVIERQQRLKKQREGK